MNPIMKIESIDIQFLKQILLVIVNSVKEIGSIKWCLFLGLCYVVSYLVTYVISWFSSRIPFNL